MFAHAFVRNAYLAGTFIALASGVVGWFVVARAQLFAGDALSHVAFVGAIAAAVVGVDERVGLFALTLAVAAGLAALDGRGRQDDAAIGTVFAWILGIGVLLIALLATSGLGGAGVTTTNALFGSIYSLSTGASWLAAAIALGVTIAVAAVTRPLLLTTIDAEQAAARGVPVETPRARHPAGARGGDRRGHAGGRRAADPGAAERTCRRGSPPDRQPLRGRGDLEPDRGGGDVGRPGAQLRDLVAAAEQRDHRTRGGRVRDRERVSPNSQIRRTGERRGRES